MTVPAMLGGQSGDVGAHQGLVVGPWCGTLCRRARGFRSGWWSDFVGDGCVSCADAAGDRAGSVGRGVGEYLAGANRSEVSFTNVSAIARIFFGSIGMQIRRDDWMGHLYGQSGSWLLPRSTRPGYERVDVLGKGSDATVLIGLSPELVSSISEEDLTRQLPEPTSCLIWAVVVLGACCVRRMMWRSREFALH